MFISTRRFEARMKYIENEYNALNDKYWRLRHSHDLLIAHLGLNEIEVPRAVKLVNKGGPEESET